MKVHSFIRNNSIRKALLIVPVICSTAFAACTDVTGTAATHPMVNFQAPATGENQSTNNVTIGEQNYNSETKSFERPWPFGPEANPQ
jgi:hypothetical protein